MSLNKNMTKICYNFMVCKDLHERRTIPLYNLIISDINNTSSDAFLIGGFEQFDNIPITKVCDTDDYLSCITKTYEIFNIHDGKQYDWYFIGDDDTFINLQNLNNFISKLPADGLAVYGHIGGAAGFSSSFLHAHGGAGILMNRHTFYCLKNFIDKGNRISHHLHSDVSLAMCIDKYNNVSKNKITFIDVPEMHGPNVNIDDINLKSVITIHVKDRVEFKQLMHTYK